MSSDPSVPISYHSPALHVDEPFDDYAQDFKPSPKRRRRLNASETKMLHDVFMCNQKPNAQLRAELGHKLNMTPRAVQIWFQNKRAKLKKDPNSPELSTMHPSIQITPDLASLRPFDSSKMPFDPASFTLPTPPGTILQQSHHLASPRHLPALDLNQNWNSPNFYLSPVNPSVNQAPNLGNAFLSGNPGFQYENSPLHARHSAAAMAAYGTRRSAPISIIPGSSTPWDSGLPVGPLSYVGTRSEIIRNKPSIMRRFMMSCNTFDQNTTAASDRMASPLSNSPPFVKDQPRPLLASTPASDPFSPKYFESMKFPPKVNSLKESPNSESRSKDPLRTPSPEERREGSDALYSGHVLFSSLMSSRNSSQKSPTIDSERETARPELDCSFLFHSPERSKTPISNQSNTGIRRYSTPDLVTGSLDHGNTKDATLNLFNSSASFDSSCFFRDSPFRANVDQSFQSPSSNPFRVSDLFFDAFLSRDDAPANHEDQ